MYSLSISKQRTHHIGVDAVLGSAAKNWASEQKPRTDPKSVSSKVVEKRSDDDDNNNLGNTKTWRKAEQTGREAEEEEDKF